VLRALQARTVVLAFDAPDVRGKAPVFEQTVLAYDELVREGFNVEMEVWE
jgi:hypothetical protein